MAIITPSSAVLRMHFPYWVSVLVSIWKSFDSSTVTYIIFLERLRSIKTNVQTKLSKTPIQLHASLHLHPHLYWSKRRKRTLLSACSCRLINWQLSQLLFCSVTVSFPEENPWWILSLCIVAPLQIKGDFCLYQRASITSLIRLSALWKSADILPKST